MTSIPLIEGHVAIAAPAGVPVWDVDPYDAAILAAPDQDVWITNPKSGCTMEMLAKDYMVEPVFDDLRRRYGDDLLAHIEFMKFRGQLLPQGLSIVRFHSKEQLWELMAYCESIGQWIANPHTHRLDEDVRWNGQPILDAKARWDPHGLLNPGHLKVLEQG